ncbi:MAG: LamG domain-containing protein, partial [Planctomycetota bacterium]|nr:LamG domain-containing protein [Planctomycetota bacterium]
MIHLALSMAIGTAPPVGPQLPYPAETPTWERYAVWGFEEDSVVGTTVESELPGRIEGRVRMVTWPVEALVLDGRTVKVHLGDDPASMLPAGNFSVEATVVIDRPQQWGGIVSALQDNGASEQGWLLGFRDDRPCFALSSTGADDGDGKMTYLVSERPFETGTLHHLLATWDGSTMRLYMDGQPVGSSDEQSGDVLYPAHAPVTLGSYEDDNEHYPMTGLLGRISIWDRALGPEEVAWWHAESGPAPITRAPLKTIASYDSAYLIPDGLDAEGKPFRPDPRRPIPMDGTAPDSIGRSFRVVEPGLMNIPVERFSIEALLSLDRVLPEGGVVAWADE